MGTSKFETIKLTSNDGKVKIEGELVVETATAWQVVVQGKVQSYLKSLFTVMPSSSSMDDLFGGLFGGGTSGFPFNGGVK